LAYMEIDKLCINTIRMLAVDAVQKANSGHPGMPMGAAPMAYVLWTKYLRHNPNNPNWPNRDRFVLSAGHGSMLLYALLHLTGYDLSMEDIKNFRQWGSRTPGHPEYGVTPGVECTTGPLGQGFANGVGMAIAERHLAAMYNRPGYDIVDHYTYAIAGDGDLMEGVASEAASLAGHLGLGKLIYLYDNNHISLAGGTGLIFTEDVGRRFEAYGWHVQSVEDGNDTSAITRAIEAARTETARPSLIMVTTHIGYGSPHKQDTFDAHGSPLGADEVAATKKNLGWPEEPKFLVPDDAKLHFREAIVKGAAMESEWDELMDAYARKYPELMAKWKAGQGGSLPEGWDKDVPVFPADKKGMATRNAGGKVMNALSKSLPNMIGGSGDLDPSTKTALTGLGSFQPPATSGEGVQGAVSGPWGYEGANVSYGVREHAMGSVTNGIALHGGLIPFASTFLIFSDYMRPALRLSALMGVKAVFVFTHDSVALGEDGPTHQPVEHLASLRAMPGMTVIRPADANETAEAWKAAVAHRGGPVALVMTRQDLPVLDRQRYADADGLKKGAYVLADAGEGPPDIILIATGSEVHIALSAYETLVSEGVRARIVSMPSWELFESQPESYRRAVLPPESTLRVSVEAGVTQGWHKYVGRFGDTIGIDRFGASAPGEVNMEKFGFTTDAVFERAKALLKAAGKWPEGRGKHIAAGG